MKSSGRMSSRSHVSLKRAPTCGRPAPEGVMPLASAARLTLSPCSSVPVRNLTSSPSSRCHRARASADDRRVGVTDVGHVVDVIDRSGDVEATRHADHPSDRPQPACPAGNAGRGALGSTPARPPPAAPARLHRLGPAGTRGRRAGRAGARAGAAAAPASSSKPALRGVEPAPDEVERLGELLPLLAEGVQALQHLVGRALELDGVDRLADDGQHREQRERASTARPSGAGRRRSAPDRARG